MGRECFWHSHQHIGYLSVLNQVPMHSVAVVVVEVDVVVHPPDALQAVAVQVDT